jgi:hypothetical protein
VGSGSVWVADEAVLEGTKTCRFQGGGLCGQGSSRVHYRKLSREFATMADATIEYCRQRTSQPRRVPLTQGKKATVYGRTYWVTNAPNHKCPRTPKPVMSAKDRKYAVLLLTNVSGVSVVVRQLGQIKKTHTCRFQGAGLCGRSPLVKFVTLSRLYGKRIDAITDYCRHRTSTPRHIPLTQGRKANVYDRDVWVSNAPRCR